MVRFPIFTRDGDVVHTTQENDTPRPGYTSQRWYYVENYAAAIATIRIAGDLSVLRRLVSAHVFCGAGAGACDIKVHWGQNGAGYNGRVWGLNTTSAAGTGLIMDLENTGAQYVNGSADHFPIPEGWLSETDELIMSITPSGNAGYCNYCVEETSRWS